MPKQGKVSGLYQKPSGIYYWQPPRDKLSKSLKTAVAVSLKTRDYEKAISKLADIKRTNFAGYTSARISDLASRYVKEQRESRVFSKTTVQLYETTFKEMVAYFGDVKPQQLNRDDYAAFHRELLKGDRGEATAHRYIRNARAFYSWLIEKNLAFENPAKKLKLPSPTQTRRDRFCSREERELLIRECTREDLMYVLMCGFHLGMRIKEIIQSRPEWFEFYGDRGHVTIINQDGDSEDELGEPDEDRDPYSFRIKNKNIRQIPLNGVLLKFLKGYGMHSPFMLHPEVEQGKWRYRWDPVRPFKQLVRAQGLDWVGFHTMRHTFGSLHAIAGTPEVKVRRWMGITVKTWDKHYAGLSPDDQDINRTV